MVVTSNSVQTQTNISKSQLYQSKKRRHELAITKKKSSQTLKPAVFFIASLSSSFPDLVFSETKVVTTQHWSLLNIGHMCHVIFIIIIDKSNSCNELFGKTINTVYSHDLQIPAIKKTAICYCTGYDFSRQHVTIHCKRASCSIYRTNSIPVVSTAVR